MKVFKCDRCGMTYDKNSRNEGDLVLCYIKDSDNIRIDLCPDCWRNLGLWLMEGEYAPEFVKRFINKEAEND